MQLVIQHSYLIPLLPLLGAILSGFFGKRLLKDQSHWPIWIGVGGSALLSFVVLLGMFAACHNATAPVGFSVDFFDWIKIGPFTATAGYFFDPLTAVMLAVVTGIGLLITIFAAGYMKGEEGYYRFFAYLGLFIFAMTNLVMGNNLLVLYLGWEGVGLCSYLLIGYYFDRPAASEAAKKAFLVNRIGDFGFAVGIMLVFAAFGTISYYGAGVGTGTGFVEMARNAVLHTTPTLGVPNTFNGPWQLVMLKYIPFALMLGAFGKSAQFPLYVWLPDAMEGPTPVSALIHAATMVTAGVYMIVRCGTLFFPNEPAMMTISAVGCFTALLAATIALRQFDLKKIFAYSTISQLGYMFVGVGVLAPTAAIFHLVTHAFFKALLFLSSGVIMHAMLGHLDMRKMSGLRHVLPKTRWLILVGCLALAGCPGFSGFFSKDEIVGQSLNHSALIYAALLFTSFLTAYYTFRLYFQVFEGPQIIPATPADVSTAPASPVGGIAGLRSPDSSPADHAEAHASHEAVALGTESTSGVDRGVAHPQGGHGSHNDPEPWLMIAPLALLALGAIFAGYLNWPYAGLARFLGHSPSIVYAYDSSVAAYANTSAPPVLPENFGQFNTGVGHEEPFISLAMVIGGAISLAGIGLAYLLHLRDRQAADRLAAGLQPLTGVLEGKWYVDELYDWTIVRPLRWLGGAFYTIDRMVVDGVVWLVGFVPQLSGLALKLGVQRGYLQGYAAAMLFGVLAILLIVFL